MLNSKWEGETLQEPILQWPQHQATVPLHRLQSSTALQIIMQNHHTILRFTHISIYLDLYTTPKIQHCQWFWKLPRYLRRISKDIMLLLSIFLRRLLTKAVTVSRQDLKPSWKRPRQWFLFWCLWYGYYALKSLAPLKHLKCYQIDWFQGGLL